MTNETSESHQEFSGMHVETAINDKGITRSRIVLRVDKFVVPAKTEIANRLLLQSDGHQQ